MPVYGGLVPLGFSHSENPDFFPSGPKAIIPNREKNARAVSSPAEKCMFSSRVLRRKRINGNLSNSRSLRASPQTGVAISIEFQAAHRHPFVGAVIDRPQKCVDFQSNSRYMAPFCRKIANIDTFPCRALNERPYRG